MRKWLLIFTVFFLLTEKIRAQCPQNIGFEDGTFNNWVCYSGDIDPEGKISLNPILPTDGIHTIESASTQPKLDPYGLFPVLCPNGSNYSVKLGNNKAFAGAEALSYTFNIPPGQDYSLILNYAVVLQNPGHEPFEQPRFTVRVFNVTDNTYLTCPSFDFVSSSKSGEEGFQIAKPKGADADVLYKDWASTSINLIGYAGKTMRLEFTTNDCTKGGHFGYAYFDIVGSCSTAITGNTYCSGQPSVTLQGPSGFSSYKWFNEQDPSTLLGTSRILKITPAPANGARYKLLVEPYLGIGCSDILYTTISKIPSGFSFGVANTLFVCKGSSADLSTAIGAGTTPGLSFSYFTDAELSKYVNSPKAVTEEGTYYINAVSAEGCTNFLPVYVKVVDLSLVQISDIHVTFPTKVDLNNAFTHQPHTQYEFFSDAAATKPLSNYFAVGAGTYYVKAKNDLGCEGISPVRVINDPPPPYEISAPSAFTPNADGVNDIFSVTVKGFVSLNKLRICNRYGTTVFEGKTLNWDGTVKATVVPPGIYYWIFEGVNDYDGTSVRKTGPVTVIK